MKAGKPWCPDFVDRIIKEKCLFGYCGIPYKTPTGPQEDTAEAAARAISQQSKLD